MIDVKDYPDVIDSINAILNNNGIVEVKNEDHKGGVNLVVVEITRSVKTKKK